MNTKYNNHYMGEYTVKFNVTHTVAMITIVQMI